MHGHAGPQTKAKVVPRAADRDAAVDDDDDDDDDEDDTTVAMTAAAEKARHPEGQTAVPWHSSSRPERWDQKADSSSAVVSAGREAGIMPPEEEEEDDDDDDDDEREKEEGAEGALVDEPGEAAFCSGCSDD